MRNRRLEAEARGLVRRAVETWDMAEIASVLESRERLAAGLDACQQWRRNHQRALDAASAERDQAETQLAQLLDRLEKEVHR